MCYLTIGRQFYLLVVGVRCCLHLASFHYPSLSSVEAFLCLRYEEKIFEYLLNVCLCVHIHINIY